MQSSPFENVHRQLGACFKNYDGWSLPADFGNSEAETDALNSHCAAVDLSSFGRVQVKGASVKEAINTIFTTKKASIATDTWAWAKTKTLNEQDVICRIIRTNGDFLLLTPPAMTEAVCEKLNTVSDRGVEASNITNKTAMLGLYGPKAFESIRGVLPFDINHLDPGDAEKMSFFMMSFTLLRGSWLAGEGLELVCPASAGPLVAGAVAKYRHKHNITPAGMDCLQAAMSKTTPPL